MAAKNSRRNKRARRLALARLNALFATLVIAMAIVAGGWRYAQVFGQGGFLHAAGESAVHTVVVKSGDTLWRLAVQHGPKGEDPRKIVAEIRSLNQLNNANLLPGMALHIPTRG